MWRPPRDKRPASEHDPLAPLSALVDVIFALTAAFALFGAMITVLHLFDRYEHAGVLSFSEHVCVGSHSFMAGGDGDSPPERMAEQGSTIQSSGTMFCMSDPNWAMQWAASTGAILGITLVLGACLLTRRTVKAARRDGLFTARPAKLLRALGWFLIAMSIIGPIGTDIGDGIFIAGAATAETGLTWTSEVARIGGPDWAPLILGVCALTFSRVMRRGVALQDEVALTV